MLDGIRANAQSWGVKLAFGLIIVVFIFWGIGGNSNRQGLVASVNGLNITAVEFEQEKRALADNFQKAYPGITPEMLQSLQLDQMALQQLVQRKLIQSEANRIGLGISAYELSSFIHQIPMFFGPDGKFDKTVYLEQLKNVNMPASKYEDMLRRDLLPEKFIGVATAGAYLSPETVRARFNFQREQRRVDYILFSSENFAAESVPTDEQIAKAYADRAALYHMPPRVRLEYIELDPLQMGDAAAITDEATAAAYQERIDQFITPERVHARHILVMVDEKASEAEVKKAEDAIRALEARIKAGEDFADVAREAGQDGTAQQGGDLGWFFHSQMVPAFADAAFALRPGEMSGPVRSPFGFHLIKLEEREDAKVQTLDEVRESLRASLASQVAADNLLDTANNVLAAALGGKTMAEAAAAAGLEVKITDAIMAEQLGQMLRVQAADVQAIMNAPTGGIVDSALRTDTGMLVIRVAESLPQMTRPLEEVRDELIPMLIRENARKLAQAEAEKIRTAFVDGKPDDDFAAMVRRSELFGRDGYIAGLGMGMELTRMAFEQSEKDGPGKWLDGAFTVDDGAVIASLAEVVRPDDEAWNQDSAELEARLQAERANALTQMYIYLLQNKASVKILNPNLFQNP